MKKIYEQKSVFLLFMMGAVLLTRFVNLLLNLEFMSWFLTTGGALVDFGFFVLFSMIVVWLYGVIGWRMWSCGKLGLNSRELFLYLTTLSLFMISLVYKVSFMNFWISFLIQAVIFTLAFVTMRVFYKSDKLSGWMMSFVLLWFAFELYLFFFMIYNA